MDSSRSVVRSSTWLSQPAAPSAASRGSTAKSSAAKPKGGAKGKGRALLSSPSLTAGPSSSLSGSSFPSDDALAAYGFFPLPDAKSTASHSRWLAGAAINRFKHIEDMITEHRAHLDRELDTQSLLLEELHGAPAPVHPSSFRELHQQSVDTRHALNTSIQDIRSLATDVQHLQEAVADIRNTVAQLSITTRPPSSAASTAAAQAALTILPPLPPSNAPRSYLPKRHASPLAAARPTKQVRPNHSKRPFLRFGPLRVPAGESPATTFGRFHALVRGSSSQETVASVRIADDDPSFLEVVFARGANTASIWYHNWYNSIPNGFAHMAPLVIDPSASVPLTPPSISSLPPLPTPVPFSSVR
ncbi:hypothetical protein DENSPDRAFT_842197 [Dentipellis sp. KUC8613]|nr:hypothetical protein DENSPDRAFT_842197 [Dentipellis sp. KUC8613]